MITKQDIKSLKPNDILIYKRNNSEIRIEDFIEEKNTYMVIFNGRKTTCAISEINKYRTQYHLRKNNNLINPRNST